jgi:hypothetical protein
METLVLKQFGDVVELPCSSKRRGNRPLFGEESEAVTRDRSSKKEGEFSKQRYRRLKNNPENSIRVIRLNFAALIFSILFEKAKPLGDKRLKTERVDYSSSFSDNRGQGKII